LRRPAPAGAGWRVVDGSLVGCDQKVIAILRAAARKLKADARRGSGHDGEFSGHGYAPQVKNMSR
jgi:hypothetical protein